MKNSSRKTNILEVLAHELEIKPGHRITTASLSKAVGVSEAALYRHFASKAQMFEALIDFAEETVFTNINLILEQEKNTEIRCKKIVYLLLRFADKNPGITRILLGDILIGEQDRLRNRTSNFFLRINSSIKQIMKESLLRNDCELKVSLESAANFISTFIEGRLHKYQRLNFMNLCLDEWEMDWKVLRDGLFHISEK